MPPGAAISYTFRQEMCGQQASLSGSPHPQPKPALDLVSTVELQAWHHHGTGYRLSSGQEMILIAYSDILPGTYGPQRQSL